MSERRGEPQQPDMLDRAMEIPLVGAASRRLQRSYGAGCFVSLILTAVIVVWMRRYVSAPFPAMVVLAGMVWFGILNLLVRVRPRGDDGE